MNDNDTSRDGKLLRRPPWNKGKMIAPKPPLRPSHVWSIRTKLQMAQRSRDLALFNLAIDSKLRGCDVVASPALLIAVRMVSAGDDARSSGQRRRLPRKRVRSLGARDLVASRPHVLLPGRAMARQNESARGDEMQRLKIRRNGTRAGCYLTQVPARYWRRSIRARSRRQPLPTLASRRWHSPHARLFARN